MPNLGDEYMRTQQPLPHRPVFDALDSAHGSAVDWLRQLFMQPQPPPAMPPGYENMAANRALDIRDPTMGYRERMSAQTNPVAMLGRSARQPIEALGAGGRSLYEMLMSAINPPPPEPPPPPMVNSMTQNIEGPAIGYMERPQRFAIRPDLPPAAAIEDYNRKRFQR